LVPKEQRAQAAFHEMGVSKGGSVGPDCQALYQFGNQAYIETTVGITSRAFLLALALCLLDTSVSRPAEREKLEEGRYGLLRNGALVAGTEQSWVLWQSSDGAVELEDHFQADKTALALFGGLLNAGVSMTPELRKSLQATIEPSDVLVIFDQDGQVKSLIVRGVKLSGSQGVGLSCETTSKKVDCKGTDTKADLRLSEQRGLFWWYRIPLLLRPWISASSSYDASSGVKTQRIVRLSFDVVTRPGDNAAAQSKSARDATTSWGGKPTLEPGDLTISGVGLENLVIGDKNFRAKAYRLEVTTAKGALLSLKVWTDAKGLILAVEDATNADYLVALLHYTSYSKPKS
jgi:hypothetical protein